MRCSSVSWNTTQRRLICPDSFPLGSTSFYRWLPLNIIKPHSSMVGASASFDAVYSSLREIKSFHFDMVVGLVIIVYIYSVQHEISKFLLNGTEQACM